jgi:hypothetical protein
MESPNNMAQGGNAPNQNNMQESESKYGKLYNVIDAFIETTNLAPNRKNAIKHGIRAIGEILSEFPHEEGLGGHESMHGAQSSHGGGQNMNTGHGMNAPQNTGGSQENQNQAPAKAKTPGRG